MTRITLLHEHTREFIVGDASSRPGALLLGAPGRYPLSGHIRLTLDRGQSTIHIAAAVDMGSDPVDAWHTTGELFQVLLQLDGRTRFDLLRNAWASLSSLDPSSLGPSRGDDVALLMVARDSHGYTVAASGLEDLYRVEDGQLERFLPRAHPVFETAGIPSEPPKVLNPPDDVGPLLGVPRAAAMPLPRQGWESAFGLRGDQIQVVPGFSPHTRRASAEPGSGASGELEPATPQSSPDTICSGPLGRSLLEGDLDRLEPRRDLPFLFRFVASAGRRGWNLGPFFKALARKDPLALVELTTGPRAPGGASAVRGALCVLDDLEAQLGPSGLYRRLIVLDAGTSLQVLDAAASRHPAAGWMIPLGHLASETPPGLVHLLRASSRPVFGRVCHDHAMAGHAEALVTAASRLGRAEPVASLLSAGAVSMALQAAAGALGANPACPVVPMVAASWGPEPDLFFLALVPLLRSRSAAQALMEQGPRLPRTTALLAVTIPGMRDVEAS